MTIRKITIDNSVRYNPRSERTIEKDIKPNTIKNRTGQKKYFKKH